MRLTWAHKLSPQLTASTPHAVNSTLTGQKVENCGHYLLGLRFWRCAYFCVLYPLGDIFWHGEQNSSLSVLKMSLSYVCPVVMWTCLWPHVIFARAIQWIIFFLKQFWFPFFIFFFALPDSNASLWIYKVHMWCKSNLVQSCVRTTILSCFYWCCKVTSRDSRWHVIWTIKYRLRK